jgi:hypothetical protein
MRIFINKLIGIVEIYGGVSGIIFSLAQLIALLQHMRQSAVIPTDMYISALIPLMFFIFYVYAIKVGLALYRVQASGIKGSMLLQFIQIPVIATQHFVYNFSVGFQLALGFLKKGSAYVFNYVFSHSSYGLLQLSVPEKFHSIQYSIHINVLAVVFFIVLCIHLRKPVNG